MRLGSPSRPRHRKTHFPTAVATILRLSPAATRLPAAHVRGTVFCNCKSMVHSHFDLVFRAAVAAAALSLAAPVQATLYKWMDQSGNVTYSNVPPPESAQARDLETIEENGTPTATEMRTRQILEEAARERRALGVPDRTAPPTMGRGRGSTSPEPDLSRERYEWIPDSARLDTRVPIPDSATLRYPPATPVTVRDPCLLSADPRCYELNAANYDPYLGYAPSRGAIVPGASGATGGGAGGTTGANSAVPGPQSSSFPLRNAVGDTSAAAVVPAAQSTSSVPRGFRGLPPGTPVLPIGR